MNYKYFFNIPPFISKKLQNYLFSLCFEFIILCTHLISFYDLNNNFKLAKIKSIFSLD